MKTSVKRVLSVLCILSLSVAVFSGCSKNPDEYSIISDIIIEDDDSGETSNSSKTENQSTGTDSKGTGNSSSSGGNSKVNPADYKGTTITYATWERSEGIDTQAICNKFKNKYGITVKILNVAQKTYIQEITSMISSGNSPDVIKDCDFWPEFINISQPLENAKIDLSDALWDQEHLKQASANGKHYSIASKSGNNDRIIVYYNKKLLQSNGIRTPEEYKSIGQWNFEALTAIMQKVSAIGKTYRGAYMDDNGSILYPCFGTNVFKYKDGKFTTGINDTVFIELSKQIAEWHKQDLMASVREDFIDGKAGIAIASTYGLRKAGYWRNMKYSDIGYIEIPKMGNTEPYSAVSWQGFGVCKGAKNPVAAGIFLTYYLNDDNLDLVNNYISEDAYTYHSSGYSATNRYVDTRTSVYYCLGLDRQIYTRMVESTDPSQIPALLSSLNNQVNGYVKRIQAVYDNAIKSN